MNTISKTSLMKHPTELRIAGFDVDVTIEYSITEATKGYDKTYKTFQVERIVIPTYDEFRKNLDNTEEDYKHIFAGVEKAYEGAFWKLTEDIRI